MTLKFNANQIEMFMRSLYTLTGIRFVLFDNSFRKIIAYPNDDCAFCKLMRGCPETLQQCIESDINSFRKCTQTNSLVMYKCHAGLVEATIPLHENDKIIGYLIFGQLSDNPDKQFLFDKVNSLVEQYGFDKDVLKESIADVVFKSKAEINAAANIMDACTSYIIYKELVAPESSRITDAAKHYIDEHLGEELNISDLCFELNVGRTKLYELFKLETKMGIAEYIRRRRMQKAKELLKTTDLPISQIALSVGFSDYNYFSKIYKKAYGKSPRHYRK